LKAHDQGRVEVPTRVPRSERRLNKKHIENLDEELGFYLKVEALLKARTPACMQQLTGKAKRFLEKYDCSALSWQSRYEIIVGAVKFAMCIDHHEDGIRQAMKAGDQDELRQKSADFVIKGKVGHSGPRFLGFGRDSKLSTA